MKLILLLIIGLGVPMIVKGYHCDPVSEKERQEFPGYKAWAKNFEAQKTFARVHGITPERGFGEPACNGVWTMECQALSPRGDVIHFDCSDGGCVFHTAWYE